MKIPCPVCVPCVDPADPFQNFSAEEPDVDHVFCYGSGNAALLPGPGRNYNMNNCTVTWGPISCFSTADEGCFTCVESHKWTCNPSDTPQSFPPVNCDFVPESCLHTIPKDCVTSGRDCVNGFAGSCAWFAGNCQGVNAACFIFPNRCLECPPVPENCQADHSACPTIPESCYLPTSLPPIIGPDKNGDPTPQTVFWNFPQTCTKKCPDGLNFTAVVGAGRFADYSLQKANEKAFTYACFLAAQHKVCLDSLSPNQTCVNDPFSGMIRAAGRFLSTSKNRWSIVSGALPEGMELNNGNTFWGKNGIITGTPTVPGEYKFIIRVQAPNGDYMQKELTLCVVGITPDTLNDGTVGAAYSEVLSATGCANAPLSWQLAPGSSLPDGLVLDEETGLISGTPTSAGTFDFTVILQTEAT